jgi:hypothetical protein
MGFASSLPATLCPTTNNSWPSQPSFFVLSFFLLFYMADHKPSRGQKTSDVRAIRLQQLSPVLHMYFSLVRALFPPHELLN